MEESILFPPSGTFRVIFFYVGQGESTLLIIPDGVTHNYVLVDSNIDEENGGKEVKELLERIDKDNIVFINTHPHNDHIKGLKEIKSKIKEVWHSGHIPSKEHEDTYKELEKAMEKVGNSNIFYLRGSRDNNTLHTDHEEVSKVIRKIGDVDFQVFAPAEYVSNEIQGETPKQRDARIHEQCGVIKFTYKDKSILLTGDSDKVAWKEYIANYYKDKLKSDILSASHHGSHSFFREEGDENEDVYEDHMSLIDPDYLIISAPKREKSQHGHPHEDALEIYRKYVGGDNIFHLGKDEKSVVADIDTGGGLSIYMEGEGVTDDSSNIIGKYKRDSRPYNPYAY